MSKTRFAFVPVILISCALILGACAKKGAVKKTPESEISEIDASKLTELEEGMEADIRGAEFNTTPVIKPINFDLDKYYLSAETRSILQKNAKHLKEHKDWETIVEGHCDDRGTIEYNLALGQKRAKEVREYYIRLGVSGTSIGTISYGEEKPVCEKSTESCWTTNRRAETKVRIK